MGPEPGAAGSGCSLLPPGRRARSPLSSLRSPEGRGGGTIERAAPWSTAASMAAASSAAPGSPWSCSIAASPPAYPWPTARTFHAPCLR